MSGPTGQPGSTSAPEHTDGAPAPDGAKGNGSGTTTRTADSQSEGYATREHTSAQEDANGGGPSGPPDGGGPGGGGGDGDGGGGAQGDGGGKGGRRKMKRSLRIGLLVILVVALVAGGIFGASYMLNTRNYVSTDNATVDGDNININAPTSGYLTGWNVTEGTQLRANQAVARVRIIGGFVQPQQAIRAPNDCTIAQNNAVEGQYVTAGTQLAVCYDLSQVYVTARVDETDVDAVHPGERVDFTVDAFPGNNFTGVVREVQSSSAGQFSLFPQSNTSGNFQKVTQVIPVKISIDDRFGLTLVPGMNVSVSIHKR